MKARWRATLSKALEVDPAYVPEVIVCCAMLHNLCLEMNDHLGEMEDPQPAEDPQDGPPIRLGGPERPGTHIRDRIAQQLAAPVELVQQLIDHDYL